MAVERYTLRELEAQINEGKKFKLFKPFLFKGQILINVEKVLTVKDLYKLDGKVYGSINVVPTVEHNSADDKLRKAIMDNVLKILKTSKLFKLDDVHHLDVKKRKECEKILTGVIGHTPFLSQYLLKIYQYSKKMFIHSVRVGIISTIIDLGIQQKLQHHDGLRSEILLIGALLHDIGFLKLPVELLEKSIKDYTDEERQAYERYPEVGKKIILSLGDAIRNQSVNIVAQHRERLLGNGFPIGLKGEDIDELALIVGLADEFDHLASGDNTITEKSVSAVMSRISRSGKLFGPHIVDAFYTWFRYLK